MESSTPKRTIGWAAVEAIAVVVAVFVSWEIGKSQNSTQITILSEQLKFAQNERDAENRRRRRPILAFDHMTIKRPVATDTLGARRFDWPRDKHDRILEDKGYPRIKNFGEGPALHIQVSYENTTPPPASSVTVPFHCLPGESVDCFHIPEAINDPKAPVDHSNGIVRITCEDTAGERHIVEQEYSVQVVNGTLMFLFKDIHRAWPIPPRNRDSGLRENY